MKTRTFLAAAALLLTAQAASADVATVSPITPGPWTGTDPFAWFITGQNARSKGGWELAAGTDPAAPAAVADRRWVNGEAVPFTLAYDPAEGLAHWTLGAAELSFPILDPFVTLVVTAQAMAPGGKKTGAVTLADLSLDLLADAIGPMPLPGLSASTPAPSSHFEVAEAGAPFSGGFALTGTVTMSWTGPAPTEDRIAFTVLGVGPDPASPAVPAPAVATLAACGMAVATRRRR